MHICVGNTQETLPAFEPPFRLLFLQHYPPCLSLSLIFIRAVVQVILPTCGAFQRVLMSCQVQVKAQDRSWELQHSFLEVMKRAFYLGLATGSWDNQVISIMALELPPKAVPCLPNLSSSLSVSYCFNPNRAVLSFAMSPCGFWPSLQ